jgi:hypothetical protein
MSMKTKDRRDKSLRWTNHQIIRVIQMKMVYK